MKVSSRIKILFMLLLHSVALTTQALPVIPLSGSALNKIHSVNNQTGYIIGNNGKVFKTTNGGASWDSITIIINSQPITEHLTDIHFETEVKGYKQAAMENFLELPRAASVGATPI